MMIIWKYITGFEGLYMVSSDGRIKSLPRPKTRIKKEVILKQSIDKSGYCRIGLKNNGKYLSLLVHRIVAKAFRPATYFDGAQVNHIDGNKTNNHYLNLEWVTPEQHLTHTNANGFYPSGNQHQNFKDGLWIKGEYQKTCPVCSKDFIAKYQKRIFCSKLCSNRNKQLNGVEA